MLNHVCQPQTSTDPKICWRCPASKVHFSVGGYSSSSGTWAPADRLPGIRMHLPDARLPNEPNVAAMAGKSCFGCFGPKQNIQNSQGLHIFPASHLALNGKRHRVITSYPPVAGTVFPAATVSAPGHAACRLMMRTVGPRFGDPEAAGGYCWKCGRGAVNTLDMSMYLQYHMIYIYI